MPREVPRRAKSFVATANDADVHDAAEVVLKVTRELFRFRKDAGAPDDGTLEFLEQMETAVPGQVA